MRLEARDLKTPRLICVATVGMVADFPWHFFVVGQKAMKYMLLELVFECNSLYIYISRKTLLVFNIV
jgi:hypothetical protein